MYTDFLEPSVRTIYKATDGTVFIGCDHDIFRSSDKGKTWKLLLPAIGKKVFNLSVSGNVIYAIPLNGGC